MRIRGCWMKFERIVAEGLAHFSYFIGSEEEAVVVDPRRDFTVYLDLARKHGLKIVAILETHRHEDFVVGSQELAAANGSRILHGQGLDFAYGETMIDGAEFEFGGLRLRALHTPGHTDESTCYTLSEAGSCDGEYMVFTGDTLFVGEVGRTDLYGKERTEPNSRLLYHSLHHKLMRLDNGVIICPAHGAGSVCGAAISEQEQSTIGFERQSNPALKKKEELFLKQKLAENLGVPQYFSKMEELNLKRHEPLLAYPMPPPLVPHEFEGTISKQGAVVVDTRNPQSFGGAHIPGSISIWLEGLPTLGGWVLPYDRPVLLVMEDETLVQGAVDALARTGYDNVSGWLKGGIVRWYQEGMPIDTLPMINVDMLKASLAAGQIKLIDVRNDEDWHAGHVDAALHVFAGELATARLRLSKNEAIATSCGIGYKGCMAASLLRRRGYKNVSNVLGGMGAWKARGYPLVK
jgi:hydroxyacylglutathione hydrolase